MYGVGTVCASSRSVVRVRLSHETKKLTDNSLAAGDGKGIRGFEIESDH